MRRDGEQRKTGGTSKKSSRFTSIELLAATAVIAIWAGRLPSVLTRAREEMVKSISRTNNLKPSEWAQTQYSYDYGEWIAPALTAGRGWHQRRWFGLLSGYGGDTPGCGPAYYGPGAAKGMFVCPSRRDSASGRMIVRVPGEIFSVSSDR